MQELTEQIKQWATDRMLHTADPTKQMLKLMEEVGELAQGMAKQDRGLVYDAIGDVYVVLTILAMQLGLEIEDCVYTAYKEIKDRRGKMVDGVFVKEEDLK
ncbi:MAG: MazG-like family protein [Peptostreptococcaceae bacterium]|nr:MazG-like family protein [Peptostreptococcaceae bacterium]